MGPSRVLFLAHRNHLFLWKCMIAKKSIDIWHVIMNSRVYYCSKGNSRCLRLHFTPSHAIITQCSDLMSLVFMPPVTGDLNLTSNLNSALPTSLLIIPLKFVFHDFMSFTVLFPVQNVFPPWFIRLLSCTFKFCLKSCLGQEKIKIN